MQANNAAPANDNAQEISEPRAPQIEDLGGVWQRTLLIEPDGKIDRTSDVYWLQLGTLCADIRSVPEPEDRRSAKSCHSAFAGTLFSRDGIFHWAPQWAYGLKEGAPPDEGLLRWEGAILREDGVHAAYVEHWRRLATPSDDDFACWLTDGADNRKGVLLRIGRFAFCANEADGTAEGTQFRLFTRDEDGWGVAASTPGHGSTGATFTWPDVLRLSGVECAEKASSTRMNDAAGSRLRRLKIEECI